MGSVFTQHDLTLQLFINQLQLFLKASPLSFATIEAFGRIHNFL
jgi:hypothetical protein